MMMHLLRKACGCNSDTLGRYTSAISEKPVVVTVIHLVGTHLQSQKRPVVVTVIHLVGTHLQSQKSLWL